MLLLLLAVPTFSPSLARTSARTPLASPLVVRRPPSAASPAEHVRMAGLEAQDVPFIAGVGLIAAGAVWLQLSLTGGRRGLGAFLSQEKGNNPFYARNFRADKPSPPAWWPEWLRLPEFEYVEVYGQEPRSKVRALTPEQIESSRKALEQLYAQEIDEPDIARGD
jgi:hypothetical protein